MFDLTKVDVDGKKKTKERPLKLPSAMSRDRNMSLQDNRSKHKTQRTEVRIKGEKRIDALQDIILEMKNAKSDSRNGKALLSFYERKIQNTFDQLYKSNNNDNIAKEVKLLEKQKFLEHEIEQKQKRTFQVLKIQNTFKYEIEKKQKLLNNLHQQLQDIEQVEPSENQRQFFEVKPQFQQLLQEEDALTQKMDNETFTSQSLDYQYDNRTVLFFIQKIINHVKRKCKSYLRDLKTYLIQLENNEGNLDKRQHNLSQIRNKIQNIQVLIERANLNNNLQFKDKFCDQLSEFEEMRAVNEIYKHGDQLQKEEDLVQQREKKILLEKQRQDRNRGNFLMIAYDKMRYERKIQEDKLKELQSDFDKIRIVTSGNIKKPSDIVDHKYFLKESIVNLHELQDKQQGDIMNLNGEFLQLNEQLKKLKYNKDDDQENFKIYELEMEFLDQEKLTQHREQNQQRLQKIIDESSLLVSRILYQLSKDVIFLRQKKVNIQVNQDQISNMLSISGLKLERMLTMIYKKKRNFKIESVNNVHFQFQEFNQERPPKYIGLNSHVSKEVFSGFQGTDAKNHTNNMQELKIMDVGKTLIQDQSDISNTEDNYLKQERTTLKDFSKVGRDLKKK